MTFCYYSGIPLCNTLQLCFLHVLLSSSVARCLSQWPSNLFSSIFALYLNRLCFEIKWISEYVKMWILCLLVIILVVSDPIWKGPPYMHFQHMFKIKRKTVLKFYLKLEYDAIKCTIWYKVELSSPRFHFLCNFGWNYYSGKVKNVKVHHAKVSVLKDSSHTLSVHVDCWICLQFQKKL